MRTVLLLGLLAALPAHAADTEMAARMAALEARVARLESQTPPAPPQVSVSSRALDKANWLRCRAGLSKDEIAELLGKANSEQIISGVNGYPTSETWIYGTGLPTSPGGSVIFLHDRVSQCFQLSVQTN